MESDRVMCKASDIDKYFSELEEALQFNIPAAFIINLDEVGFQDYVDSRRNHVIVPSCYTGDFICIPVNRDTKRATMLGAISADGDRLKHLIIFQRETIEEELIQLGYTPDKFIYCRSEKGYITTELFSKWVHLELFPRIQAKRIETGYDGYAIIIMDGFSAHQHEKFIDEREERNIKVIFLAPHSSDQT